MSTENLNSSAWYIPGFNTLGTPKADRRHLTTSLGAFTALVYTSPAGVTPPAEVRSSLFTLAGLCIAELTHLQNITTEVMADGSTQYTLGMLPSYLPSGDVEVRTYVDGIAHLTYVCNNFSEIDDANVIIAATEGMPRGTEPIVEGEYTLVVTFDDALPIIPLVFFSVQSPDSMILAILESVSTTGFTLGLASAPAGATVNWITAQA